MSDPRRFEELRDQPDAEDLGRLAQALDVEDVRGPRPEFVAALRARLAAEPESEPMWQRFFGTPRLAMAWAAALVLAIALGAMLPLYTPAPHGPAAIAGERLVLVSQQGFLSYDPRTLELREMVLVPAPEPWVVLAPDQRTLVFTFGSYARQMRVYDLATGAWDDVAGVSGAARQLALSSDGARAYVRDGAVIRIVDVAARAAVGQITAPDLGDAPLYLAPDDRRLFQFLPEGGLVVYDVEARREVGRLSMELKDPIGLTASARVAFSPDGTRLYAVGSTGSPTGPILVKVLDTRTLAVLGTARIDPATLPVLSRRSPLQAFQEALGELAARLVLVAEAKELGTVHQIALSPDGRTLYAARGAAGPGVAVIDAESLRGLGLLESARDVYGLQLSADGSRVFLVASPSRGLGDAALLALDAGTHAVVASASTRAQPQTAVLIHKH